LVDQLFAIWQLKHDAQNRRDEIQLHHLHIDDVAATDQRNINRGKDAKPYESILHSMLPSGSKIEEVTEEELRQRIFARERENREKLGLKH